MESSDQKSHKSDMEVTVLKRKIVDSQSAISKYRIGKFIVTVESLFSLGKTYHDLLFQIIRNKLQK